MFASMPVITRLYSPSEFGIYVVYVSFIAIAGVLTTLRYELAIPLPKSARKVMGTFWLSAGINFIFLLLFSFILFFFNEDIFRILNVEHNNAIYLLPVMLFIFGWYRIFTQLSIQTKEFKLLSKSKVYQTIFTLFGQLSFSLYGSITLVISHILGMFVYVLFLKKNIYKFKSFNNPKQRFFEYIDFPKYSLPGGMFRISNIEMYPIVFTLFYSPYIAGVYALSYRLLIAPASLLGAAIGNVFTADASSAFRENRLNKMLEHYLSLMIVFLMPGFVFFIAYFEYIAPVIFGDDWKDVGLYVLIMSPWMFMVLLVSPFTIIPAIASKQKIVTFYHLFTLCMNFFLIYFFVDGEFITILNILSSSNFILRVIFMLYILNISKSSVYWFINLFLFNLMKSILVLIPLYINLYFNVSVILVTGMSIILLSLIYLYNLKQQKVVFK